MLAIEQQALNHRKSFRETLAFLEQITPIISPDIASGFDQKFTEALRFILLTVCAADCPINDHEARMVNLYFYENFDANYYNEYYNSEMKNPDILSDFASTLGIAMRTIVAHTKLEGREYYPENDKIISLLSTTANTLI